jgi:hypothetical protein
MNCVDFNRNNIRDLTRTHVVFRVTDALVAANEVIKIKTDEG